VWGVLAALAVVSSCFLASVLYTWIPATPTTITTYQLSDGYQPGSVCTCTANFLAGDVLIQALSSVEIVGGMLYNESNPSCPPLNFESMGAMVLNTSYSLNEIFPCLESYFLDLFLQAFYQTSYPVGVFTDPESFDDVARATANRTLMNAGPTALLAMGNAIMWSHVVDCGEPNSTCRYEIDYAVNQAYKYSYAWPQLPMTNVSNFSILDECADAVCTLAQKRPWYDTAVAFGNFWNTLQSFVVLGMAVTLRLLVRKGKDKDKSVAMSSDQVSST